MSCQNHLKKNVRDLDILFFEQNFDKIFNNLASLIILGLVHCETGHIQLYNVINFIKWRLLYE
ncbi:hypothetical protein I858_009985 [Planococcus versutus]|uniref:Uncharacterized protein n=1 Tax=Planococcus versutus TaxID=1302659 RepID=A0A1B1S2A0_9BACL|nr:hypothetical protein I858_009985 [Planococcus versutus]